MRWGKCVASAFLIFHSGIESGKTCLHFTLYSIGVRHGLVHPADGFVTLDQLTKKCAVLFLKGQDPVILIRNVFQLYYLENHGAAFGLLQGRRSVFICITVIILALIIYLYVRIPFKRKFRVLRILMVLIAAGAVGNFIDRVTQHYVVDFFYFEWINFPVFNVADIYVTCATILLVLVILFRFRDEDVGEILSSIRGKRKKESEPEEK